MTTWGIEDETSPLEEVLLGPPDRFEWLPTSSISKAALASGRELRREDVLAAHGEMACAYEDAGVRLHRLQPDPELRYQVFSRDSSIWASEGPIVTLALGNDRVMSTAEAARLNERLRARGLTVYAPDLWPFTMGGGGPHCLAQPLRRSAVG